ncbi:MAG: ABC transporter substrate-binding protein [Bradyrhizobium sp.]|nr:ABC transporter substrate-binding protein [Bradyrhizobium sp.]
MTFDRRMLLGLGLAAGLAVPSMAVAEENIKIGVLATFEGAFAVLGDDSMRGAVMAIDDFGGKVGGKTIEIVKASSDGSPDSAVRAVRKLVEQDGVKVIVGPLSGDEGLAVKDYAKTKPDVTIVNGTSGAQDTTLRDPAPNFFRFSTDGAQWMAGLGEYAFKTKGYKRIATLAEDYSFPYTQVFGFMAPYCKAGGRVVKKFWVPIGTKDFSSVIAAMPDNIDAIYVVLGGSDSVNFLTQYQQAGGQAPLIGGSVTVDQTILGSKGKIHDVVVGTPSAGPIADNNDAPGWKKFVEQYKKLPNAFPSPSLFAHGYYVNATALLTGLEKVNADVSDGGGKLRATLASLVLETPTGKVSLDKNRNAIADEFLTEVTKNSDGTLYNKLIKVVPQVNQTLGIPEAEFLALGKASRDNPSCP